MADIAVRGGAFGGLSPRAAGKVIRGLDGQTRLAAAEIEQAAEIQTRRTEAIAYVGRRALHEIALLSELEQQLAGLIPTAAGRLQAITDLACIGMADVVSDTVRKVR